MRSLRDIEPIIQRTADGRLGDCWVLAVSGRLSRRLLD
jgi:hypothetical protein